jgi:hypothetical protein
LAAKLFLNKKRGFYGPVCPLELRNFSGETPFLIKKSRQYFLGIKDFCPNAAIHSSSISIMPSPFGGPAET